MQQRHVRDLDKFMPWYQLNDKIHLTYLKEVHVFYLLGATVTIYSDQHKIYKK